MSNQSIEQKLANYIQAINEIAKSKVASYKAESLMDEHPLYDKYAIKLEALQEFIAETKLNNWADGLSKSDDKIN